MSLEDVKNALDVAVENGKKAQEAEAANTLTQVPIPTAVTPTAVTPTDRSTQEPSQTAEPSQTVAVLGATDDVKDKSYAEISAKLQEKSVTVNGLVTEALKTFGDKIPADKIASTASEAIDWAKTQIAAGIIDPMSFNKSVTNSLHMYLTNELQRETRERDMRAAKDAELLNTAAHYFAPIDLHEGKREFEEAYAATLGYSVEDMRQIVTKEAYARALNSYRTGKGVAIKNEPVKQDKTPLDDCIDFIAQMSKTKKVPI